MKRRKPKMDRTNMPECSVRVRKLTLDEISRITISPFFISNKCGKCHKLAYYGPKCTTCSVSYHFSCAVKKRICCELPIIFQESRLKQGCPRCLKPVEFGAHCTKCDATFHSACLSPYDQCCTLNLCRPPLQRPCGRCRLPANFGPRCPFCANIFHANCAKDSLTCCDNKIVVNDSDRSQYNCGICRRGVSLGCAMCAVCGDIFHNWCLTKYKGICRCCRRPVPLEIYFIPSFRYVIQYFKRKGKLNRLQQTDPIRRTRKKSAGCQTSALDRIQIVSVKTEADEVEVVDLDDDLDLPTPAYPAPPVLERETCDTPNTHESSNSLKKSDSSNEESLKNLFDFLYSTVRNFPPQLQTQVKIDLFKIVTEAEMKHHS